MDDLEKMWTAVHNLHNFWCKFLERARVEVGTIYSVPTGLGSFFIELTPDLRPGLSYVVPSGLGWGGAGCVFFAGRGAARFDPAKFTVGHEVGTP